MKLKNFVARFYFLEPALVERTFLLGGVAGGVGAAVGMALESQAYRLPSHGGLALAGAGIGLMVVAPTARWGLKLAALTGLWLALVLGKWDESTVPFIVALALGVLQSLEAKGWRKLTALVAPSLGVAWCFFVVRWLGARHLGSAGMLALAAQGAAGLFIAAASALGALGFSGALEARLAGHEKILKNWTQIRQALAKLPKGQMRAQLDDLARRGVERWLDAHARCQALAGDRNTTLKAESEAALSAVTETLSQANDPQLREQLQQMLRVHRDTLEQLASVHQRLHRAEPLRNAHGAWLEMMALSADLANAVPTSLQDLAARLKSLCPSDGQNALSPIDQPGSQLSRETDPLVAHLL